MDGSGRPIAAPEAGTASSAQNLPWWGRLKILTPAALLVFASMTLVLAGRLHMAYHAALDAAHQQAQSLAHVLADDISSTIFGADQILRDATATFPAAVLTGPANPAVIAFLRDRAEQAPYLYTVSALGADGMSHNTSLSNRGPLDLSQRDYFRAHRDDPAPGLRVSPMIRTTTSGEWTIWVSRRVSDREGRFAGVISAALSPAYFANFYTAIRNNPDCALGLYTLSGIILARQPLRESEIGRDLGSMPLFTRLLPASPVGVFDTLSPLDGIPRILAYQRLPRLPLIVTVGLSRDAVIAQVWREGAVHLSLAVLIAVTLAALVVICRQLARRLGSERALRVQSAALRRSNDDLERFADILAHHLQEPVRAQHAFAQLLRQQLPGTLSAEARDSLDHVLAGAQRLRSLIRDVQLYLTTRLAPPARRPCDADAAFGDACGRFADAIARLGACVEKDALPPVWIDRTRLAEIFKVLLENALEYRHPDRSLRIRVTAGRQGGHAVFSVTDNGIGIAPEYRGRVFRIFERLHSDLEHPGTGVGLSLAKRIVEAADGQIWIEAGDEGGARVCFTLAVEPP